MPGLADRSRRPKSSHLLAPLCPIPYPHCAARSGRWLLDAALRTYDAQMWPPDVPSAQFSYVPGAWAAAPVAGSWMA